MKKFLLLFSAILSIASCTENNDYKTDEDPQPEPQPIQTIYEVGDLYNTDGIKGIVFRVDEGGKSGLIASLTEPESMLAWGQEFIETGSTIKTSGEQNTAIIYTLPNWKQKYPAFVWCKSLGSGWYIPAIDELQELITVSKSEKFVNNLKSVNATPFATTGNYLSSTEMDQWWIYLVNAANATQSANYKQYTYNVRAIHTF